MGVAEKELENQINALGSLESWSVPKAKSCPDGLLSYREFGDVCAEAFHKARASAYRSKLHYWRLYT